MSEVLYADETDECISELRRYLDKYFRDFDAIEEGLVFAIHRKDRMTGAQYGRMKISPETEATVEEQWSPAEFERELRKKSRCEWILMVPLQGQRNDYRIYVEAQNVREARDLMVTYDVLT